MNINFKNWLNGHGYSDSTANSRVANILTVERHYGDIDTLIRNGGARNLLNELSYSTEDERNGLLQKHRIPIHGNIRTGSATLKQAVMRYLEFCKSDCTVKDGVEDAVLSENADGDVEKEGDKLIFNPSDKTIFDILGVSRLETVHSNFLKWLIDCSREKEYPIILKRLIQSIAGKAYQTNLLRCDSARIISSIKDGDCRITKVKCDTECTVHYKNRSGKKARARVDLVIDALVNGDPIKIIIENKVYSREYNNQTKIYYAYFSGKDSELTEAGLNNFKIKHNYKPRHENEIKIYVFLHPSGYDFSSKAQNLSEYFIKYTYQNLLEDVIFPSMDEGAFSPEEKVWLADYVRMLITPDKNGMIMANESDESRRLMEFKAAYETYTFAESQKATITDNARAETYSQIADDAYGLLGKIGEEEQIKKVRRRVPGWKRKPDQVNSKILGLFMELSDNGKKGVFVDMLEDEFDSKYPEERGNFTKNYNQMKNFGVKNHAKVFSEDAEKTVWLWEPVKDFIIEAYSH